MTALFVSALLGVVLTAASLYAKAAIERRFYRRKKNPILTCRQRIGHRRSYR